MLFEFLLLTTQNRTTLSSTTNYQYLNKKAIYCNDRSVSEYRKGTYNEIHFFGPYERISNYSPSLACGASKEGRTSYIEGGIIGNIADKFTADSSTGNGKLEVAPFALPTADEIYFAGLAYRSSYVKNWTNEWPIGTFYKSYNSYWTMSPYILDCSPSSCSSQSNKMFFIYDSITDENDNRNRYEIGGYGYRPVVSLIDSTPVLIGNGTFDNPYVVSMD